MAYAGTSTVVRRTARGRRYFIATLTETEAAAGSEATIAGLPALGRVVDVHATLTAGTGTTIDPEGGRAAAWVDLAQDEIWQNGAAAAHISAQPGKPYYSATGTLYWRSTPNSAVADHSIVTQITIAEGAEA